MIITVFAAMHHSYRMWGALAVDVKGNVSAILFLHFGSLIVTFFITSLLISGASTGTGYE
jgi:hypothetical protein